MKYSNIREEELKNKMSRDIFRSFDCTRIIGNIDFCVGPKNIKQVATEQELFASQISYLWAEAKKGQTDLHDNLVQLILTIGKARTFDQHLPPKYLGAFDSNSIAFIAYNDIQEIFYLNDFNWNVRPSDHNSREFALVLDKVKTTLQEQSLIFDLEADIKQLKEFVKANFVLANLETTYKIQIDKNNFISIYNRWLLKVEPSINENWDKVKKSGIISADFYLADLLSHENKTLKEKLFVLLQQDHYKLNLEINQDDVLFEAKPVQFKDKQQAHTEFWNLYQRPPKEEYWDYIIERRDLLVPQDIRERKGSFFTPQAWVELSQKYLADSLGKDWQQEFTVWDCAAGTGNLLHGLTNKYNIWASTIDKADVDIMLERVENGANLLASHIFQFDFLNDNWNKLPKPLFDIINDPKKRKKLLIYINPPYAEAGTAATVSGTGTNKSGVTKGNSVYHQKYKPELKSATNEIFALFMARIYKEIPNCHLAQFSTLKFINGTNFKAFKQLFKAKFKNGFLVPANTFDNVQGDFPIGFTIWNLHSPNTIQTVCYDVYNNSGHKIGNKKFYGSLPQSINKWIKQFDDKEGKQPNLASLMPNPSPDFQNNNFLHISLRQSRSHINYFLFNLTNILQGCIYFAVRYSFESTWLNNRDQFLYPNDSWQNDYEFQNNCLAFTLFHNKNRISCNHGVNHWIPFSEQQVNSQEKFQSNLMMDFMQGRLGKNKNHNGQLSNGNHAIKISDCCHIPSEPLVFSQEAQAVFEAGRELWQYYHQTIALQADNSYSENAEYNRKMVNASYYDIREYFQGRNKNGRMNQKSSNPHYMELLAQLKSNMEILKGKIQLKVYQHGFLLE